MDFTWFNIIRFGYTHFLHQHDTVKRNVSFFFHDIVCQYWPWANRIGNANSTELQMTPCLPAMHAKAHSWHCQVYKCLHMTHGHVSVFINHRCYGVVTGKMVQQQVLEKTWKCCLVICQDGDLLQRICWPIVCMNNNDDDYIHNNCICVQGGKNT